MKPLPLQLMVISWFCALLAVVACGCGERRADGEGRLTVAVSIAPQAWLVQQVGAAHVDVVTVVEPGSMPETYQPTDAQVSRVMAAKVFFRIGVPFENSPGFESMRESGRLRIVDTRQGVAMRLMTPHAHGGHGPGDAGDGHAHREHTGPDPHIWLSPRLLKTQARTIADTLAALDPTHGQEYEQNLQGLERRLDELDRALRETLEPIRGKAFLVLHPAWGYFADQYGLRQMAIEVEGKEPTDHELTELQRQARGEGIRVVFIQPQTAGLAAHAVARAIGGRVEVIDDLEFDVEVNLLRVAQMLVESLK